MAQQGEAGDQQHAAGPSLQQPTAAPAEVTKRGYAGFGSFMVDRSVEEMIHEPESTYQPPARPFPLDERCTSLLEGCSSATELGRACRHLFMIDFASWTYINHGAFGGVCRPAHLEANQWREHCEAQPLRFLDRELFPHVVRVMRQLAAAIHARPQDLVLLPNATTGLNVAIRSAAERALAAQQGQQGPPQGSAASEPPVVYMLDIGYGSVKKMAVAACPGTQVVYGHVTFPQVSCAADIVELVASTLPARASLAVFDAVTSNTALVLPLKQLVDLCRSRGVPVLVDAAHALGQLPVDVAELDADFYVTNCHKWLAGPRGSALMWVHPRAQRWVRPLVVSHGSGSGFVSDFIWDGCRDYAPYLGLTSALDMWRRLGWPRCQAYMRDLLARAVALLVRAWGTDTLAPLELCACMALVRLPDAAVEAAAAAGEGGESGAATSAEAKYVQDVLHLRHRIECPVKCVQGRLYVRISACVYNDLEDYQALATAVSGMS